MASTYKTHTRQTDNTSFILKTMAMICLARGDGCGSLKYHSLEGAVKVKTEWMIRKEICSVKPKVVSLCVFFILSQFFLHFNLEDFINQDPHTVTY